MLNHAEWKILPTHNYLLIQKTGCSYVCNLFEFFYQESPRSHQTIPEQNQKNICWTTIRNPYERFISGLAYDIHKTNVNFDIVFSDLPSLINGHVSAYFRSSGKVQHTISQVSYIMHQPISMFVDVKDLTEFCSMNFNTVLNEDYQGKVPTDFKILVQQEIENRGLTQRVQDLLSYETYVYEKILQSDHIWRWQNGNILGTDL